MKITIAVTAKNEEQTIQKTLQSIQKSIQYAEGTGVASYRLLVALNDTTDTTETQIPKGIEVLQTKGGLVEAQRAVAHHQPFVIYSDADILVSENAVYELTRTMLDNPTLKVAYTNKIPNPPARKSLLALALHTYNLNYGFETKRRHFNGTFFAIRNWSIPPYERFSNEVSDNFYNLKAGVLADDIYLSKSILAEYGESAIAEIHAASIRYQAPETLSGMYRYYRRMRLELTRIAMLFPEMQLKQPFSKSTDWDKLANASSEEKFHWLIFQIAFRICKARYQLDRIYYSNFSNSICPIWPPVTETKAFRTSENGR